MSAWTVSPWLDSVSAPAEPLCGSTNADAVVIGGGLAGLSTALELRGSGMDVVLLEREITGFGASGRNAGHLTPTIGKDLPTLRLLFGKARAAQLVRFAEAAVDHVEELITRFDIACDYQPVGNVLAAVHARQHPMIDRAAAAAAELGADAELLDDTAMRARGLPPAFTRGLLEGRGGLLNPARYTRGLREAAVSAGVRLHEHTGVRGLDLGRSIVAHADRGHVRAPIAVLTTNAFTGELDLPVPAVARLAVQLFATAPLSKAQREHLGWEGGAGVYTAHEILESYRLTSEGRIVGGSKHIRYSYDNRPLPDVDPATSRRIEQAFRQRFPTLGDVPIAHHWGGPIAIALDFLPRIGRAGPHRNLLYTHGFAGHGLAQASYAGRLIVDLLHDRENLATPLITRRGIPLPPEPLRWMVARALTGLFEHIDAKTDRLLA